MYVHLKCLVLFLHHLWWERAFELRKLYSFQQIMVSASQFFQLTRRNSVVLWMARCWIKWITCPKLKILITNWQKIWNMHSDNPFNSVLCPAVSCLLLQSIVLTSTFDLEKMTSFTAWSLSWLSPSRTVVNSRRYTLACEVLEDSVTICPTWSGLHRMSFTARAQSCLSWCHRYMLLWF